ncbi:polysaccharide deacetylase family protein [Alicyclobacillus fastidiosus]|uniref:polysaccharide deacetylase family protein n=1 Tax=Alicyclobacillus fastidiosus TaxID=392011 RepID=UPI0023E99929|nr:hypothetical protein GCM10025859_33840 [Alicyclobacillus fastidiosus]
MYKGILDLVPERPFPYNFAPLRFKTNGGLANPYYYWNQQIRQLAPFQHGPERLEERPSHSQHIDWHALYPSEVLLSGSTNRKEVALTFDDGPDTIWTPRILSILSYRACPKSPQF